MQKEKFSLKDALFNPEKIHMLADSIKEAYDDFEFMEFAHDIILRLPELELKERIHFIKKCLKRYLPSDFEGAVKIILESLPPELDPSKSDDDFGDFIYAPYGEFVAEFGCKKEYLELSFCALGELTKRFSMENAVRYFLNAFEEETFTQMKRWSQSENYHQRRLASEGTRPRLPWCMNIGLDYKKPIQILENLYFDNTRYVTRSVANHMNDIAKKDPDLVLGTLEKWKKSGRQNKTEMDFIISHSLRTLIKDGYKEALNFLGYSKTDITVDAFSVFTPVVNMGENLEFEFEITHPPVPCPSYEGKGNQNLLIDYVVYFVKANGGFGKKVFKIGKKVLKEGEVLKIRKKQLFREMTTRKFYPGEHFIELQINGESFGKQGFELVVG